jgi:xylose isomerase
MEMFDLSINLGNILVIVAFIGGGISFAYSIKSDTKITDLKYTMIAANMDDFKMEMKKLTEVVTQQALQNKRMDYIEDRQMSQGKRLDQTEARLNLYADSPIYERRDERSHV